MTAGRSRKPALEFIDADGLVVIGGTADIGRTNAANFRLAIGPNSEVERASQQSGRCGFLRLEGGSKVYRCAPLLSFGYRGADGLSARRGIAATPAKGRPSRD